MKSSYGLLFFAIFLLVIAGILVGITIGTNLVECPT